MKIFTVLTMVLLLSGCFFVVKDEDKVKIYGSPKETALDTLDKLGGEKTGEQKGPESPISEEEPEMKEGASPIK
jgi:hypothetical protein